ncbi:MAG: M50 family metallopeptidase, partial [Verrucomicrobiota bacterium]
GKVETTSVSAPIPKPDPNVSWTKRLFKRPDVRRAGIGPAGPPIIVGDLKQDGPGELAGLQEGDLITHLNGEKLYDFFQIQNFIMAEDPASLELTVEREGELQTVTLLPREPEKLNSDPAGKRHGIKPLRDELRPEDAKDTVSKHVPPHVQINATLKTMWNTLSAVFSPNTGITATHLSAAPGILNLYFNLLASSPEGWKLVLWFSVLLNVNLAIMNLLPIPILDGGHITMALIEGISRRPISLRVLEVVNAGCALLLIGFMLFLSLYDTRDIVQQNQRYLEHSFEPISGSATP